MNLGKKSAKWKDDDLFVVASSITNGLFLHMAGKDVKEIYRFLNSDHPAEMLTLCQRKI